MALALKTLTVVIVSCSYGSLISPQLLQSQFQSRVHRVSFGKPFLNATVKTNQKVKKNYENADTTFLHSHEN